RTMKPNLLAGLALLMAAASAAAAPYPERPITMVVPYAPGGPTDIVARAVGQELAAALGQPVLVDNRPGANESIAASLVAKARPDGYTVLFATDAALSLNASLYRQLPYDAQADFTPVTRVAD